MFLISGRHVLDIARPTHRPAVSHLRFGGVRRQRGGGRERTVWPLINSHPPGQGARRPSSSPSFVEKWTRFTSSARATFFLWRRWLGRRGRCTTGNNPEGREKFHYTGANNSTGEFITLEKELQELAGGYARAFSRGECFLLQLFFESPRFTIFDRAIVWWKINGFSDRMIWEDEWSHTSLNFSRD